MSVKYRILTDDPARVSAEALVVLHTSGGMLGESSSKALQKHIGAFARAVAKGTTRAEWFCTIEKSADCRTAHLLLDSATFGPWMPGDESLKTAAARAVEVCRRYSLARIAFVCGGADVAAIHEGAVLGDFADTRFKSEPARRAPLELLFVLPKKDAPAAKKTLAALQPVVDGVNVARELVNAPNNVLTPAAFAKHARSVAKTTGMQCEVLSAATLEKRGYGLISAVGRGSDEPPCLIVLRHKPARTRKGTPHIALVGKGVCFDTGGISIKPAAGMHYMNGDMGGAAAVMGAMQAIAALKLPVRVTGIVPAVINAVDGASYLPGAIIRSKSGKTVFIDNTDAEGRLVLADALAHAGLEKADVIVDFATLTGAAQVALGPQMGALFTDDAELRDALLASGERTGDSAWHLPLWREYDPSLDHALADVCNTSSIPRAGGAIHAANFLRRFVPDGARWAHFDMSAAARAKSKARYFNPGATGWGVRLVVDALQRMWG